MEKQKLFRLPRLLFGTLILFFVGIIYAWSIIKFPFETMWDPGLLGFNYTLTFMCFLSGVFISGLISKKMTSGARLIISAVLMFSGFFLTSLILDGEGKSVLLLFFSYGVLGGIGIGIVYNTVISSVNAWYPDKVGFSSGMLLGGFGFSSMILGRVLNSMGTSEIIGWRNTYVIIAVALGVILFISSFIIKPPPAGTNFPASKKTGKSKIQLETKDYPAKEMIKRFSFVQIAIVVFTLTALGNGAVSFAKDVALDIGATEGFAITMVGLIAVANGLCRPVVGWLYDTIGLRKTQYIVSVTAVLAPLMLTVSLLAGSLVLGAISLCLCGVALGMSPTTCSVFTTKFYGAKYFAVNFGIFNLIQIPAPFTATLMGNIKDSTGEFLIAFIIMTGIGLVGAIVNLTIKKP